MANPGDSLESANQIDEICDLFEFQWQEGTSPKIEDVLANHRDIDRSRLLRELLLLEIGLRRDHGESPTLAEYTPRFPDDAEIVDAAFHSQSHVATPDEAAETVDFSLNPLDDTFVPGESTSKTLPHSSATKPLNQDSASDGSGRRFGDYELLEEIARGGMGVVYKARQISLNRVVALKMIKSGELAGQVEIQRFYTEAEAAAQLDHPDIVPVFEVGEHRGLHFFSMGFVDGAGLDARLTEGPLPPRQATELMRQVASAVQYAHDRGIVHRDLKPANILVDGDGKPRITDFGLAKNIATDSGMTATGQVMGTPSYMPPEQAEGRTNDIGPQSDVYSLGALLYATLTGRPPFQAASIRDTLNQVIEREPLSPTQLNPAVDRDLETICLTCLQKDASKRYASADALADDLGRCLSGMPIAARPIGRVEKTVRWCRRNRLATALVAMLVAVGVAGPIIATVQFQLRKEADANLELANRNRDEANRERRRADQKVIELDKALAGQREQTERANRNLANADSIVNTFVLLIGKNRGLLGQYPATQPLRKQLLGMGRRYYEKLIQDNPGANLSLRLAQANYHLGVILKQSSGEKTEAIKAFREALRICDQLPRRESQTHATWFAKAGSHNNLGLLLAEVGETDEALNEHALALDLCARLVRENSKEAEYTFMLASCHNNIGSLHLSRGRNREAGESFQKARLFFAELLKEDPDSERLLKVAAACHSNIGIVHGRLGNREKQRDEYRTALKLRERLHQEAPRNPEHQHHLASSYHNFGILYNSTDQQAEALVMLVKARDIWSKLVRENSVVADYQHNLARCQMAIGKLQRRLDRRPEAITTYRNALRLLEKLSEQNADVSKYLRLLADCQNGLGVLHTETGHPDLALGAFQKSLEYRVRQYQENKSSPDFQEELAASHNNIGLAYIALGKPAAAMTAYMKALVFFERLADEQPEVTNHLINVAGNRINMSELVRPESPQKAIDLLDRAISDLDRVLARDKLNRKAQLFRGNAFANRAQCFEALHRYDRAAEDWKRAMPFVGRVGQLIVRRRLCIALGRIGRYREATGMATELLKSTRDANAAYDVVCTFAVSSLAARRDPQLQADARQRLAGRYEKTAISLLRALARSGYFKLEGTRRLIRDDPDLIALRPRTDFRDFAELIGVALPARARRPSSALRGPSAIH